MSKYTLRNLFSGKERKIIIPDIQRDYCWGDRSDLASSFAESLAALWNDKKKKNTSGAINLGMIYGYEEPENSGRIHLCDGQQRLTTLFLLLGLINRKTSFRFKDYLGDDKNEYRNPRLLYSIRESTLYFLSDLTYEFFMKDDDCGDTAEDIRRRPWYFADYDNDPSICSILKAIDGMNKTLDSLETPEEFGDFLLDSEFIYYDLGNRVNGEETFVLINTTGEPLTATENLKPKLVSSSLEDSRKWEKWEQFFWSKRGNNNDTSDNGLNEFFRWISIINLSIDGKDEEVSDLLKDGRYTIEAIKKNGIGDIDAYFEIVRRIAEDEIIKGFFKGLLKYIAPEKTGNAATDRLRIVPILLYLRKFPEADSVDIKRIVGFFENLVRRDNSGAGERMPKCLRLVNSMESRDILSFLNNDRTRLISAITEEEVVKLEIIRKESARRGDVEKEFEELQESPYFDGNITPLLRWSSSDDELSSESFSFEEFQRYSRTFKDVFTDWQKEKPDVQQKDLDVVRRTLLKSAPNDDYCDYPYYACNWTLCSEVSEWKKLLHTDYRKEYRDWLKEFFDSLKDDASSAHMEKMCEGDVQHVKWDLQYLLKYPEILEWMENKRLYWVGMVDKVNEGFWLILKNKTYKGWHTSLINYALYWKIKKEELLSEYKPEWTLHDYDDHLCIRISRRDCAEVEIHTNDDDDFYLLAKCKDTSKLEKLDSYGFHVTTVDDLKSVKKEDIKETVFWMKSEIFARTGMPEMSDMMKKLEEILKLLS